jgi:uncharacterized protein YceK
MAWQMGDSCNLNQVNLKINPYFQKNSTTKKIPILDLPNKLVTDSTATMKI